MEEEPVSQERQVSKMMMMTTIGLVADCEVLIWGENVEVVTNYSIH